MPKVWIDNYLRVQTEVDLPESCPSCKQDFHEHGSLLNVAFTPYGTRVRIDENGELDYSDGRGDSLEDELSVEWRCVECDASLVAAAEHMLPPGVKMDYVLLALKRAGIELRTNVLETEAAEEAPSS